MFGSFNGKAQLGSFEVGEEAQSVFINATFAMTDPESAQQLKTLVVGVRALLALTQAKFKPLIAPI